MAKRPNHFISEKQFQKRPNGNSDIRCDEKFVERKIFSGNFSERKIK